MKHGLLPGQSGSTLRAMRMWPVVVFLSVLAATLAESPDSVRLKDEAAITGKILVEKKDQVVVDVGYTVLVIPRDQIVEIRRGAAAGGTDAGRVAPPAEPEDAGGGARSAGGLLPESAPARPVSVIGPSGGGARRARELFMQANRGGSERSVREWVNQLGEAVVQVRAPSGLGSGFFINEEGYLITNFHVIEGETQISVEVYHQRNGQLERKTYKQVRIVAMNKFEDLALLKIEDAGVPQFAWVPLGDADSLAVGERVFAIGSPLGLERTVTEGIISTKTRQMQGGLYLQTTAQINPGNSGGPLFSLRGEVVGVTNMKINLGEGLGFAIPVEQVRYFLTHRDAYAYDNENPSSAYRYLEPPRRLDHEPEDAR